jgi:hypothetical protein
MDMYIERPEIWPDFHDSLIAAIRGLLQPLLRPRYAAVTQDRLYVVEIDEPEVFELWREEVRQPLIHIVEPAAGNRLVTAIEVLSPDNKLAGAGRRSYLKKRDEFYEGGANLVEIDLLRAGEPTVRISAEQLASLAPWHYLVAVTRRWPSRQEVYPIRLERRLPRIAVPLDEEEQDVPLNIQAAFTRCWDEGPYPELLHYGEPPPGEMPAAEIQWCKQASGKLMK